MWRFAISDQRVDEKDPLFFHRPRDASSMTARWSVRRLQTGCDEVVFLNKKGELTEGTRTNLFLELDGRLFTPAPTCGLLPGTFAKS